MPRIKTSEKLNNASKLSVVNRQEYTEMYLDAGGIHPSEENFYPTEEIEELADNMLLVGHLDPILIGRVDGVDNIISGHRRFAAIQLNIARGHKSFRRVRCLVKEMPKNMFMLTLISGNAFNRVLDDVTLVRQVEEYKKYLKQAVDTGEVTLEEDIRKYIAKVFGKSETKIAQVNKINSSLSEEGKQAFENGGLNFSKAYEVARLPEEEQHEAIINKSLLSADVRVLNQKIKEEQQEEKQVERVDNVPQVTFGGVTLEEETGEDEVRAKVNRGYDVEDVHEVSIDYDGFNYLTIFGHHINGWFIAIPNHGVCCEAACPTDIFYNTGMLREFFNDSKVGQALSKGIAEYWSKTQGTVSDEEGGDE